LARDRAVKSRGLPFQGWCPRPTRRSAIHDPAGSVQGTAAPSGSASSGTQAALWHAKTEFTRYAELLKKNAASEVDVDNWRFQKESTAAALLAAQAQVEIAKLNLSYTEIRAPFDGRIGRHLVDPGNVVGAMGQQTTLAQIDQIDPLYVYFTSTSRICSAFWAAEGNDAKPIVDRKIPIFFALAMRRAIA